MQLAESSLAHELLTNGPSALYYTLLARLHAQNRNYEEAEADLNEALKLDHKVSVVFIEYHKSSVAHE